MHRAIEPDGGVIAASIHGLSFSGDPGAVVLNGGRFFDVVDLFTGGVDHTELQVSVAARVAWPIGIAYGDIPAIAGGPTAVPQGIQGPGWFQLSRPELVTSNGSIFLIQGPTEFIEFRPLGPDTTATNRTWFRATNGSSGLLCVDTSGQLAGSTAAQPDMITIHDTGGRTARFFGFAGFDRVVLPGGGQLSGIATTRLAGQLWAIEDVTAAGSGNLPVTIRASLGGAASPTDALISGCFASGNYAGLASLAVDSAGRTFSYVYSTPDSSGAAPRLAGVQVRSAATIAEPSGVVLSQVTYTYSPLATMPSDGKADLVRVDVSTLVDESSSAISPMLTRTWFYRYDTAHRLLSVISGEGSRALLVEFPGTVDVASLTAASTRKFASVELARNAQGRVSQLLRDGIAGPANAPYLYAITYGPSPTTPSDLSQPAAWAAVDWPTADGNTGGPSYTTTFNSIGQPLIRLTKVGSQTWTSQTRRDALGRVRSLVTPEASGSFSSSTLLAGVQNTGLTLWIERFAAAGTSELGAVRGLRRSSGATAAEYATANWISSREVAFQTHAPAGAPGGVVRQYTVAAWDYPVESATASTVAAPVVGAASTTQSYSWWAQSGSAVAYALKPAAITTTDPVVPTSVNGSGNTISTTSWYDPTGNVIISRARTGRLDAIERDSLTGLMVRSSIDASTAGLATLGVAAATQNAPAAHVVVNGESAAYNRVNTFGRDRLGRITWATSPDGRTSQTFRSVTQRGTLLTINVPIIAEGSYKGPSPVTEIGHDGQVLASGIISPNAAFKPAPGNEFGLKSDPYAKSTVPPLQWVSTAAAAPQRLTAQSGTELLTLREHDYTPDGSRPVSMRSFHEIAANKSASTSYGFNAWGMTDRVISPSGDVDRLDFNSRGMPVASKRSTLPAGSEVTLSTIEYDGGLSGKNGLPTTIRRYREGASGGPATIDELQIAYDAFSRPRSVRVPSPAGGVVIGVDRDNAGQVLAMAVFDAIQLPGGIPATTRVADLSGGRLALDTFIRDPLGRVARSERHFIDPTTGLPTATGGTCNTLDGMPLASSGGGSIVTDTFFGAGGNVRLSIGESINSYSYDRTCALCNSVKLQTAPTNPNPSTVVGAAGTTVTMQAQTVRDNRTGRPVATIVATAGDVLTPNLLFTPITPAINQSTGAIQGLSVSGVPGSTLSLSAVNPGLLMVPLETISISNRLQCGSPATNPLAVCLSTDCDTLPIADDCKRTENRINPWDILCGQIHADGREWFKQFNNAGQTTAECERGPALAMMVNPTIPTDPLDPPYCPGKQRLYRYDDSQRLTDILSIASPNCSQPPADNAPDDITLQQIKYANSPGFSNSGPSGYSTPSNSLPREISYPGHLTSQPRTFKLNYNNFEQITAITTPRGDLLTSDFGAGGALLRTTEVPSPIDPLGAGLPALPAKVTSFGYDALSRVTSIATSTAVGVSPFDTLSLGYNAFDLRCSMRQVTEPPYTPPAGGGGYGGIVFENRIRTFFDNPNRLFGGGRGREGVTERLEVMDDPQNIERFIRQSLPSSPAAEPDKTLYCACTIPDTSITAKPDIQTPPSWKDAYNGAIYPKNDLVSPGAACGSPDPWPTGSGTSPHDLSPGIPAEHKYGQTLNPNDLCSDAPKFDLVFPSSGLQPQSPPTGPPQAPSNAQPVLASPPANASGVWSGMSNPPAHYNIIQRDASGRIERLYSPDRNLAQGSGTYDINDRNFGYDCDGNLIFCSTGGQADLTQELLPPPPKRIEWATKDRRGNLATKADLRSGQPLVSGGPPAAAFPATFDDTYLTQSFTKADQSSLLTQRFPQGSSPQTLSNIPRWDANGNMIDDGERFLYQYDARNRLVAVYHRALESPQIFARFTYNGIGWRTTAVYDTNGDGSFSDETIEYYGYNDAWQLVRIDRQGPVKPDNTRPAIRRYQAIGYLGGQQAARYPTDRPVVRLRDTDGDGIYDEKLSYIQNFRGDVVALVKRVAKLDFISAHAAENELLSPLAELPDNTSIGIPVPPGFFEGEQNEVNLAVEAAYSTLGYTLTDLKSKVDAQGNLPPIPIAGRGMVVERYSYGLYGDPDTLPMADVDRSGVMVKLDAGYAHAEAFDAALNYVHPGAAALQGDLRADVDGDGMLSSWDQLRFGQQQSAWMMVTIEAMATGSGEDQNGWSTQNALSRHHPLTLQADGEPLSTVPPTAGALSPRDNYKLRGLVQLDNRLGFSGYVWDPFLKMYHNGDQVFNPRLGIWLQPDPAGYAGGWNMHEFGLPTSFAGISPAAAFGDAMAAASAGSGCGCPTGADTMSFTAGDNGRGRDDDNRPARQRPRKGDVFDQMGLGGDDFRAGSGPRDGRMMETAKLVRGFTEGAFQGAKMGAPLGIALGAAALIPGVGWGLAIGGVILLADEAAAISRDWWWMSGEERAHYIGSQVGGTLAGGVSTPIGKGLGQAAVRGYQFATGVGVVSRAAPGHGVSSGVGLANKLDSRSALEVERSLLEGLLEQAISKFGSRGLTPSQRAAVRTNPKLYPLFKGERIDMFFREAFRNAPVPGLKLTPRGEFGPDVLAVDLSRWYDVTTPSAWRGHTLKYTPVFGPNGCPLLYDP